MTEHWAAPTGIGSTQVAESRAPFPGSALEPARRPSSVALQVPKGRETPSPLHRRLDPPHEKMPSWFHRGIRRTHRNTSSSTHWTPSRITVASFLPSAHETEAIDPTLHPHLGDNKARRDWPMRPAAWRSTHGSRCLALALMPTKSKGKGRPEITAIRF